ncbi:hypothetical protein AVEN_216787-1 [Araneus ventricosus]|uniref:Uncharacterized protein n=1 Tax=Araneus ventricosus TaxID=182803 RepID=A0A4Y2KMJ7_ARAVE|nr:hypothetical protein AVEN_216787-1 [Araneus ventricosus]
MNNKEEISVQNRFNTANELPQRFSQMKLQCTIAPDIFQCDHRPRGPHIAFCTQYSRRPKVTCPQECSAQSVLCCPVGHQCRDPTKIEHRLQITPREKSHKVRFGKNGHGGYCLQDAMCGPRKGVHIEFH